MNNLIDLTSELTLQKEPLLRQRSLFEMVSFKVTHPSGVVSRTEKEVYEKSDVEESEKEEELVVCPHCSQLFQKRGFQMHLRWKHPKEKQNSESDSEERIIINSSDDSSDSESERITSGRKRGRTSAEVFVPTRPRTSSVPRRRVTMNRERLRLRGS